MGASDRGQLTGWAFDRTPTYLMMADLKLFSLCGDLHKNYAG